jgi:hypothetical protein
MKDIVKNIGLKSNLTEGFEKLSLSELNNIRGGNSEERGSSKETDVYDKREG